MIDGHTHLDTCKPPNAELVADAAQVGITRIVTIGMGRDARLAIEAAERFPQVYAAVAIHPNDASGFRESDLDEIRELVHHPRCVAVGETGLDYYREHADPADQMRSFLAHIELAREVGKPLMIHARSADEDTLRTLDEHAAGLQVILHCFSMADRVDECLAHENWWLSFAGNVTYKQNADLAQAALRVPASRLLVETDAPYLSPQPLRGKPNVPANVVRTAEFLALERRVSYYDFEQGVEAAAAALYGW